MAETIKGINVVIGAETTGLSAALSDVNKKSREIQSELRQVEKLLKMDPSNIEAVAQKQKLLTEQIAVTTERLNRLKTVEKQVQDQFQRGDINETQYRAFRREIEFTQNSLEKLKTELSTLEQEQKRIASSTKQLETLFAATGKSADDFADVLGSKLVNAIKSGQASADQLDQAIKKIGQAALGANVDLEKMQATLKSVDDGNSIANVRKELAALSKEAEEAQNSIKDVGIELENVAGALAAGGGVAGAISQALDVSSLDTKIEISMDVAPDSVAAVKEAVRTVTSYIDDQAAALEGVRRQWALNADASDEANARIVQWAATIAKAYEGIDYVELIQEINEISRSLEITNDDALALVNALLRIGFPPEQLDIISEYGTQLKMAGYEAEEIQAIFAAGVETGSWNIDNLLDGLKEGRIRLAEFGQEVPKAISELLEGTSISAQQLQAWGQAVAEGGEKGKQAYLEVAQAINQIDDATVKNQLGVAIWGTMWEDQGQSVIDTILNASGATVDLQQNQQLLNDTVSRLNSDPAVKLQKALADLKAAAEPMLDVIADVVSAIADWMSKNPTLAATIMAIATVIGTLIGVCMALAPVLITIKTIAAAVGLSIGAIAAPVGIAVAAITGLIAIGVALYKNWDEIKAKLNSLGASISQGWQNIQANLAQAWENMKAKASESMTNIANTVRNTLSGLPDTLKQIGTNLVLGLWGGINEKINWLKERVTGFASGVSNTVKSIFGIQSPSKVMELYGAYIAEGLAKGITENKAKVEQAATEMAQVIEQKVAAIQGAVSKTIEVISLNTQIMQAKFDLWKAKFGETASQSELFRQEMELQQAKMAEVNQRVELLTKAYEDMKKLKGEAAAETQKLYLELLKEQIAQAELQAQIAKTTKSYQDQADAIQRLLSSMKKEDVMHGAALAYIKATGKVPDMDIYEKTKSAAKSDPSYQRNLEALVKAGMGIEEAAERLRQSMGYKNAGIVQNITINSPTPLSPSETARQIKNASRALAMEW